MSQPVIPRTYEEWKHCITVLCGIELTPAYVFERIEALSNLDEFSTQRFVAV